MPIYEYQCCKCGHYFEKLIRSANGTDEVKCEKCSGKVRKLISTFAFSGSGGTKGGQEDSPAKSSSSCGSCSHSHCSTCK